MTIYDIAQKAGVSIATVSRVLNESPKVSRSTRDRVLQVIAGSGYVPSAIAQNLSNQNSLKNIGIICYNFEDIYFARAVSLLEKPLREKGYNIILVSTGEDAEQKTKSIKLLESKQIDALILLGSVFVSETGNAELMRFAQKIPVLIISGKITADNIYSFYCDDKEAIYKVTSGVLGKLKSAVYVSDADTYSGRMKINGFLLACKEHGIDGNEFVLSCKSTPSDAMKVFSDFYKEHRDIKAVITSNDLLACGILSAARETGASVPDDLAVIGYNNSVLCECSFPTLTSIDNKIDLICEKAVGTLTAIFDGAPTEKSLKVTASLSVRETYIP